ncbi:cell division protein ZapA [Fructilactobacillus cliffordii]|uniref:Cell division protein ZapA n=1 Tax=Fructilactobacillus cliffordii TaxID=2940299 RepID=A0A9Q8ZQL0_9LACO|nr:cell division protein ZapA [Fructilactobacillus cliffordii]USS86803.1 cell division protein ZapA [Fructilactobacillus cliffordii]USS89799.1 cell division protein ZapA [Fructilactobacillus cliffordii]
MNNKRRFKTRIGKKEYTLIGAASDQHMRAVAKILNDDLNKLQSQSQNLSEEDAAILLAFNAISEQLDKQLELDQLRTKLQHDNSDESDTTS